MADAPTATADAPTGADSPLGVADAPADAPEAIDAAVDAAVDAPETIPDAGLPDAALADAGVPDAGPSVTMTFHFASDSDGYTATFADTGLAMAWHGDDGEPAGSLGFTATLGDSNPVALKATFSSPVTWETWGVPPGAQVVAVRVKSYKRRLAAISGSEIDHHWSFQIVSPANQLVHDGFDGGYLEFASLTRIVQDAWETVSPLDNSFAVLPAFRASDQQIFPKIWYFPLNAGTIDWRLDELQLEISYNP